MRLLWLSLLVFVGGVPQRRLHQLHNIAKSWFWEAYPPSLRVSFDNITFSVCDANISVPSVSCEKLSNLSTSYEFPGPVTFSGVWNLHTDPAQLKMEISIAKRIIDTWTEIPCSDAIGSCDYDDICGVLAGLHIIDCPLKSCICPLEPGVYDMSRGVTLNITLPPLIPNWLTNGDFRVQIRLFNDKREVVGCLQMQAAVSLNTNGQEFARVGARSQRWRFTHAITHQEETASSCDPDTFLYKVCNLTSTEVGKGCPAEYDCEHLTCPIPGLCWLPKNCTCDEDHTMECDQDPTHKDECNTKFCGLCQATEKRSVLAAKEYFFRGSRTVPIFLSYENVESRFRLVKKLGEFGDDFEDIMD